MKTEMKVLLYLKRNEQSEKDMCPLMGRISIKGRYNSTTQFSCKMKVDSKIWNATSQRCTGKSKVATSTNREIEKLLLLLRYRFNEFLEDGQKFSAEDLKNAFQGIAAVQMTLLKLFKSHNEELALCVGVNRTQNTYLIYDKVYRGLEKYIHSKKKVSDVPLKQLDMMFIEEYDLYLKIECKYKPATRIAYLKVLKKLMNMATCRGLVPSNPFKGFKSERPKQTKRYLEMDELKKVMTVELDHPSDILARDLFVFSALTGVCYCDMRMLTDSNIVKQADETIWLQLKRHKTGTPENVRLTDIPITLIDKYKGIDKDGHLFPMPSYTTIRLHLKTIADKCKLGHYFSYHQARHTFGTTICLGNGIPIETVSKIMGHCSINITQHYAKVTERKIADDVQSLGSCIDKKFSLAGIELPPSRILRDYSQRHQKPRLGKKKKSVIEL